MMWVLGPAAIAAAVGAVFFVGMRAKVAPVLNAVRRMNRITKRLVLKSAGTAESATAVVRHVGRVSGRSYETPVVVAPTATGFDVALPYGRNTDWLKNVLAAGRATIVFKGDVYEADRPEVVSIGDATGHFQPKEQRLHRQFNVQLALRLRSRHPVAA